MRATNIKATRMELLNQRKRLRVARRGHDLLKDKRDDLMKHFLGMIEAVLSLRRGVEEKLEQGYRSAIKTEALMGEKRLNAALYPRPVLEVEVETSHIGGVPVPKLRLLYEEKRGYSLSTTPAELDRMTSIFKDIAADLVKLAEAERAIALLSVEIERTRRRVNALEHIVIPQIEDTVRYIYMKLEEMERSNFYTLMRFKQMAEASQ